MKKLYLVRHGKSEANENYDILFTKDEKDVELIDQGYLDAIEAGKTLKVLLKDAQSSDSGEDEPFFITSPWTRAYQTFSIVITVLNVWPYVDTDDNVVEHNMNLKGNKDNWEKFTKYKESDWDIEEYMNVPFEGGESLADVRDRAKVFLGFVEYMAHGRDYNNIVVVTHGQFIKMVLAELDGIDPKDIIHPKNGEVIVREIK